jgi:hypothetical protein
MVYKHAALANVEQVVTAVKASVAVNVAELKAVDFLLDCRLVSYYVRAFLRSSCAYSFFIL